MDKYSPYPGDIIDAKLEPGEFVMNRNAVDAIGKENLEKMNNTHSRYPNEMAEGGLAEQNALKLRRANQMTNSFSPQYVGNMSRSAYDNATTLNRTPASGNKVYTTDEGYNQWLSGNYSTKSPMALARIKVEKADAAQAQILHSKQAMDYGHNPFSLDPTGDTYSEDFLPDSYGDKPPPPMKGRGLPTYLSTIPTTNSLEMGVKPVASSSSSWKAHKKVLKEKGDTRKAEIAKDTAVRHAERIRMIYDSRPKKHGPELMSLRQMAEAPRGSQAQQINELLKGNTLDDLKISNPVAYETLKKKYGFAFTSKGDQDSRAMDRVEEAEDIRIRNSERFDKEEKAYLTKSAEISAQAEELRGEEEFERQMETEESMMKKAQWTSNMGLPGWEDDAPRKVVNGLITRMEQNNQVESDWVDGKYDDDKKEQFTMSGYDLTGDFQSFVDTTFTTSDVAEGPQPTPGERQITVEQMKERAQNLRAIVHSAVDMKGLYDVDSNPTGISTEQLSQMNSVIDDGLMFNMQGRESASAGEYRRTQFDKDGKSLMTADEKVRDDARKVEEFRKIEKAKLDNDIAKAARQAAIDNMEAKSERKKSRKDKLKSLAGSLLFGQRGGSVGYEEGGSVKKKDSDDFRGTNFETTAQDGVVTSQMDKLLFENELKNQPQYTMGAPDYGTNIFGQKIDEPWSMEKAISEGDFMPVMAGVKGAKGGFNLLKKLFPSKISKAGKQVLKEGSSTAQRASKLPEKFAIVDGRRVGVTQFTDDAGRVIKQPVYQSSGTSGPEAGKALRGGEWMPFLGRRGNEFHKGRFALGKGGKPVSHMLSLNKYGKLSGVSKRIENLYNTDKAKFDWQVRMTGPRGPDTGRMKQLGYDMKQLENKLDVLPSTNVKWKDMNKWLKKEGVDLPARDWIPEAYQEGGRVSLNNSRRLYNVARRKYA